MTLNGTQGTPSITLINTKFIQETNTSNFYGFDDTTQTAGIEQFIPPTTCTPTLCTSNGYTNPICVNKPNPNEGVICFVGCQPGKYGANVSACHDCPTGTYGTTAGIIRESEACSSCATGRYNPSTGQTSCLLICPGGRYGNVTGASSVDEGCPNTCPLGRYGDATGKTTLEEACSHVCEPGKYGSRVGQTSESDCLVCPNGFYCSNGLKNPCSLGKYGKQLSNLVEKSLESSACVDCPVARFGAVTGQSVMGLACLACPAGRYGNEPGMSNATGTVENYCPNACPPNQYLKNRQCITCPVGAFCPGGTDASGILALTGYWRVPNSIDFIPCLYACACLGAVNPQEDCQDPMLKNKNHPEGCHESSGYRANSTLCADCLPGYSRDGTGKCKQCGERGLNKTLPFVFGFMLLLCLLFLVWTTVVKRGGAFKNSDGAKKIFISFLQLAALSTTMQIPWPGNYLAVFKVQSMVSSVGKEFIDVRCAMDEPISIAAVEYYKTLAYALLPPVLTCLSVIGWCTCGRVIRASERRAMLTGTIVLLLYLVYPSICSSVLSLWRCQEVKGLA